MTGGSEFKTYFEQGGDGYTLYISHAESISDWESCECTTDLIKYLSPQRDGVFSWSKRFGRKHG
jgi:hypothetical protein